MHKIPVSLILSSLILFCSCNQQPPKDNKSILEDSNKNIKPDTTLKTYLEYMGDTAANVKFRKYDSIVVKGNLHKPGDHFMLYINTLSTGVLHAKIITDNSPANIRFNQIILPDGTMNGPFGNQLTNDVAEKGKYTLIISQSLMASDAYVGPFTVGLALISK